MSDAILNQSGIRAEFECFRVIIASGSVILSIEGGFGGIQVSNELPEPVELLGDSGALGRFRS